MATTAAEISVQLIPLCRCVAELEPPLVLENTPSGTRYVFGVKSIDIEGERLKAHMKGGMSADWAAANQSGIGTLDVRAMVETDDGALIFIHYGGRLDMAAGAGKAPVYAAPLYDTGDPRYAWLAKIQAVAKGVISEDMSRVEYEVFEVR